MQKSHQNVPPASHNPREVQGLRTKMQNNLLLRNMDASLTAIFNQFFYCFKKKRKTTKRDYLSQILDCIYFHLYIMCREKNSQLCYFTFSLFKENCFCCLDYSKCLNTNVCMLQHANRLWYPPPPTEHV